MSESNRPGMLYIRACRRLGKVPRDTGREKKLVMDMKRLSTEIRELEAKVNSTRIADPDFRDAAASAELENKRKKLARLERIREQRAFRRAMRITGMGLRVEEVVRFSSVMAAIAMLAALPVAFFISILLGLGLFMAIAACAGASMASGLAVFTLLVTYPERLARGLETEAFGAAPEVINYIVMSMELSPSLDRAVEFAAANADGPMAAELRSIVWNVKARRFTTTEEALISYADELRETNEELASAMYSILSAVKDREREKARSGLRQACDTVLTGTRQRVEGFAASLGTPATVLFSLGILLPMIIGSMLPMLSMGGFDMGVQEQQAAEGSWIPTLVLSILLMNLAFPLAAFAYASSILSRRPGIHTVSEPAKEGRASATIMAAVIIGASALLAFITGRYLEFWGLEWSVAALLLLSGLVVGIRHALTPGKSPTDVRKVEKLEEQIPDMLFQLGSRLGEGQALERAIEDAAETLSGTEIGNFLVSILARMRRGGNSLGDVLFSDDGIVAVHPSRKLRAALRLAVEAAGKDPETAAGMLITMSNHMRELASSDREMRIKLRSTVDSMKNTAILFGPVIMGVTVGLYGLLSETFSGMNGSAAMPTPYFIMIIGIYLMATVATIMYFCSGIERGRGHWKRDVATALPLSAMIFCAASLGSMMAFG